MCELNPNRDPIYGQRPEEDGFGYPVDNGFVQDAQNNARSRVPGNRYGGNRGVITERPSRDRIVKSYSDEAAARARNARMESQKTYHDYQVSSSRERQRQARRQQINAQLPYDRNEDGAIPSQYQASSAPSRTRSGFDPANMPPTVRTTQRDHMGRAIKPLTSEESRVRTRQSQEYYENQRATRDVLSQNRAMRTPNRQVIDARGSVDSRAFNEFDELVGYSIDDQDKPQPFVDSSNSKSRWRSHAGQGFDGTRERIDAPKRPHVRNSRVNLTSLSDTISGKDSYGNPRNGIAGLPFFVKVAVPVIVILIIILFVILFG